MQRGYKLTFFIACGFLCKGLRAFLKSRIVADNQQRRYFIVRGPN